MIYYTNLLHDRQWHLYYRSSYSEVLMKTIQGIVLPTRYHVHTWRIHIRCIHNLYAILFMTKMYTAYLCHKCRELCDGFRDDFFHEFWAKIGLPGATNFARICCPAVSCETSLNFWTSKNSCTPRIFNGLGTKQIKHRISFFTRPMLKCRSDPMNVMCSEQNGKRYDCAVCPDLLLTVIRTFFHQRHISNPTLTVSHNGRNNALCVYLMAASVRKVGWFNTYWGQTRHSIRAWIARPANYHAIHMSYGSV